MFFAPAFVTLSALATFAFALTGPKVLVPAKDQWWVAKSSNVLTWDCHNTQAIQFGVYIKNKDPNVLSGPLGIIARLENTVCSKEIDLQQVKLNVGPGYTILITNVVNQTDVLSQSEEFEIKPLGSPYPTPPASSTGGSIPPSSSNLFPSALASDAGTGTGTGVGNIPPGLSYVLPPALVTGTGTGTGTSANSQNTGIGSNGASSCKSSLGYSFAVVGGLVGLIVA
ncbi:hypothetical protein E1B28_002753 [Marasmius oreades]|uniref:Uncharacterized protein n=1 Tax=Marasmius oreades TaxID=181124 RepID=A0A9P7RNP9_9AGAR|nr:uncharacterized protein E1B28_002753 [Marasmius oreades]KAG7086832.1 hypothetical protein E1B28_002753 [Marasmius oreades]